MSQPQPKNVSVVTPPMGDDSVTVQPKVSSPQVRSGTPVGDTELEVSWPITIALVTPGLALFIAVISLELTSPVGIVLALLSVAYLIVEAIYLQPRFAFQLPGLELERVALSFSHNRIRSRHLSELASDLEVALQEGLGIEDLILILQSAEGQLSFGGDSDDMRIIAESPRAIDFLSEQGGLVTREILEEFAMDPRSKAVLTLLDRLEADVMLGFCHGEQLLGYAIFDFPMKNSDYAEAFLEVVSSSMTSGLINQHLRQQAGGREALSQVFAFAQTMQSSLLPDTDLVESEKVQLQGWSDAAEQCGGDLWAWKDLGDGQILLFVGDATGHGVSPATLAAAVSGSLAAFSDEKGGALQPDRLLADLNRLVREVGRSHHTMSAFAAVMNTTSGEIRFANAGHNPPLVWSEEKKELTRLTVAGSMLGSADELHFARASRTLSSGDMVFLFSDGITEAGEPDIACLGEREFRTTLEACVDKSLGETCKRVKERVFQHLGDLKPSDDMTFVAVRFDGSEVKS